MYSRERFCNAKFNLVKSMLSLQSIEAEFLKNLLSNLAFYGEIDQRKIDLAMDAIWDALERIPEEERDDLLADLLQIGEYYVGRLSYRQKRELARIYEKCLKYLDSPDEELLQEIEEML